jgi:nicotinate-nucleotide pyrophosphorylase (carboxylating)
MSRNPLQEKYASLLPPNWTSVIPQWLQEDIPSFDYGGYVVGETPTTAHLFGKTSGVLAGVPFVNEIFRQLGCTIQWHVNEGERFPGVPRKHIATVTGPARKVLLGERTALNLLARCSGIATRAREVCELRAKHRFKGVVAATRKTTPGFRLVEKYGVTVGGCDTHRQDLSSMVMLKDNHVWSTGSIASAVTAARDVCGFSLKIEVECRNEFEADEAVQAGADVIMLDNMEPRELKAVLRRKRQEWGSGVLVEASGGITVDNIADYFCDELDVISLGWLTQGVPHVDFSLKIQKDMDKP